MYQSSKKEGVFGDNWGKILLILLKNICCDPSLEQPQPDSSDEGLQHMVSKRNKNKQEMLQYVTNAPEGPL